MRKPVSILARFLFTISPGVPVDLRKRFAETSQRNVGIISYLYGLFFCFCLTGFFCWTQGTLLGSTPGRIYFLKDKWNIPLYLFVCPLYVALACRLIVLTFKYWTTLSDFANKLSAAKRPNETHRLWIALFVIFLICAFFTTNYLSDILNPANVTPLYWFMNELEGGNRVLNRAGYYYVVLNFSLLFITALGVFCFFSLALEVLWVGGAISDRNLKDAAALRNRLESFTEAYVIAKLLAADYMLNAFIWKASPLGKTSNLRAAGLILTVVGVFFIAVPRLYVELKWFQHKALTSTSEEEDHYKDLRPGTVQVWMHVLDTLLIGGFITAFWGINVDPLKWLEKLVGS